jgi:hypothetical protein
MLNGRQIMTQMEIYRGMLDLIVNEQEDGARAYHDVL